MWRETRNDFHSADFPLDSFHAILDSSPPRAVPIAPNDTVSGLVRRFFNISRPWTPAIYDDLITRITSLNPGVDFHKLTPGTSLKLPQLPLTGKSSPGPSTLNRIPNLLPAIGIDTLKWSEDSGQFTGLLTRAKQVARAAQTELQYFRLPADQAKKYVQAMQAAGNFAFGQSGRMNVVLAGSGAAAQQADPVLSGTVATKIRSGLATANTNSPRPIVVILDDSIPDSASFKAAKEFILSLSSVFPAFAQLKPSSYAQRLTMASDAITPSAPDLLYPNLRLHAGMIHKALDEFTDLDPAGAVKVIYLPLGATQTETIPIVRQIIYLGQLLKLCPPGSGSTAMVEQSAYAESLTEQIVSDNSALGFNPVQPFTGEQLTVSTDSIYLESISILLKYYSDLTRRPHILSFSWTVPDLQLTTFFQPGAYGWKVTASGNGANGQTVNVLKAPFVQFAYRGLDPKDFVIVANSTGSSDTCPSNTFDDPPTVRVLGLAFPGNINSTLCGTSFSAPRVAWLLGAREVLTQEKIAPDDPVGIDAWIDSKEAVILSLQRSSTQFIDRYSFDVGKLLGFTQQ
ncbi:MAG TPA: hypothetical protein VG456_24350 [Candidatus Sulfopaludibacter sp.]|nr:hypothetical protein [Candidatus Sulfopaludibacter sp.]